jgi:glycosyltransferase involved in cell wall biosynthesis
MNILFVHQNFPGQFLHLAKRLAADPNNRVVALTLSRPNQIPRVTKIAYQIARQRNHTHPFLQNLQNGILHGEAAAWAMLKFQKGYRFKPDVIYAHPGWGETLYLKDVFPDAQLIHYCEYFYRGFGGDSFGDLQEKVTLRDLMKVRTKNAVNLLSLQACDLAVTPTHWQWRVHPEVYRSKIRIIHDGIDLELARPDADARVMLSDGRSLSPADNIITYVNRALEPCRGLYTFMDAAEIVAKLHPTSRFLVVGAEDGHYYGPHPPKGRTYKELALDRVPIARNRMHFLGRLEYSEYLKVLQISSAHVYFTTPFVLSWSMLEAMAVGCVVIGSNTPPVAEVIEDGRNGLLADYFSPDELAKRIMEALNNAAQMQDLRRAARQTVLERYGLDRCLFDQIALINEAVGRSSFKEKLAIHGQRAIPGTAGLDRVPKRAVADGVLSQSPA